MELISVSREWLPVKQQRSGSSSCRGYAASIHDAPWLKPPHQPRQGESNPVTISKRLAITSRRSHPCSRTILAPDFRVSWGSERGPDETYCARCFRDPCPGACGREG